MNPAVENYERNARRFMGYSFDSQAHADVLRARGWAYAAQCAEENAEHYAQRAAEFWELAVLSRERKG